jgi:hypothetical protein
MSKWHDITEAGRPQDLPTRRDLYEVTIEGMDKVTSDTFDPACKASLEFWDKCVIAWREMPRVFVPGKRKPKPARFEHEVEVSGAKEPQRIRVKDESGDSIAFGSAVWQTMADAMWGSDAREHIEQTRVGKPIHVRVTVEIG